METEKNEEKIIETFVNQCIDNIIKLGLIEGVIDLKSFAAFANPIGNNDEILVEGIRQGVEITFKELSREDKKNLERFSCNALYDKEYPKGGVTRRAYEIEEWSAYLLTLIHKRIMLRIKK